MKKLIFSFILSVLFLNITTAQRGTPTGFDGDNFSLEGALEIFKQSHSIKDFERNLNTRDRYVNNLDLNLDGRIDYIRVEHKRRRNYHAIILQVPINRRDLQDVAVIEIEKTGRRTAMLQIIGDDYLYGNEVIVEPIARGGDTYRNGVVNVYKWPAVRHILRRGYNPWISPYRYSYYPTWWSPWSPYSYNRFYPNTIVYHPYYGFTTVHRLYRVYNFYRPYRVYCPTIVTRSNNVHVINGTTRRPIATTNKIQKRDVVKRRNTQIQNTPTTSPTRRNSTVNKRRTTSPVRTQSPSRVNKTKRTPTRATTPTRVNKSRSQSSYKPRTSTTSQRRSSSSVKRSTPIRSSSAQRTTTSRAKTTSPRNKQRRN